MNNETKQFVENLAKQHGYLKEDVAKLLEQGYTVSPVLSVGDNLLNNDDCLLILSELVEALDL